MGGPTFPHCKRFVSSPPAKILSGNLRKSEQSVDSLLSFQACIKQTKSALTAEKDDHSTVSIAGPAAQFI
jgi:hypothetical protein